MTYGTLLTDAVQSSTANTPPQFNDSTGTQVGTLCRAWVNFNGVTTATIRASFNVSSVTRNSTGLYTVNFTNPISDVNYSAVVGGGRAGVNPYYLTSPCFESNGTSYTYTTNAIQFIMGSAAGGAVDCINLSIAIFR